MGVSTQDVRLTWGGSDGGSGVASFSLQVSINGGAFSAVTLPSALATSLTRTLAVGTRYQFRVRATDRAGNVSAWAAGPSITPARIQDTSSSISRGGTWYNSSSTGHSAGTSHYASAAGRSVNLRTSARDIAFVAPTSSSRGSARIYIDGVYVGTVSLRSSSLHYRQVLFSRHFTTLATHTIKVVVVGNGRVDLDCFDILR